LATTLQKIAEGGAKEFYSGSVANDLIEDLEQVGSIITLDDLKNYR
jgi:gamma-glutamyltranspeptidase